MAENLVNFFIENLGDWVSKEVLVFIISLFPILELRGGIIAAYALGVELLPAFIIAYVGNILPIPFILMLISAVFGLMKKTPLKGLVEKVENKTLSKSGNIEKYGYFGLFLFVAIPLPGTGGWTGALLAVLLNMNRKKSFVVIAAGIFTAGIIMSVLSFGLLGAIGIG